MRLESLSHPLTWGSETWILNQKQSTEGSDAFSRLRIGELLKPIVGGTLEREEGGTFANTVMCR